MLSKKLKVNTVPQHSVPVSDEGEETNNQVGNTKISRSKGEKKNTVERGKKKVKDLET